jgi:hypothetical protein
MTDIVFSYRAAKQRSFDAREATIEDFDPCLKYELERELNCCVDSMETLLP